MKNIGCVVATALLIAGCSSISLDPQANRVIATTNVAPKGCKYVGQVVGNQGDFFTGAWTPNKNLEQGAMNDLKNQASKMGANYVHLITMRAGHTDLRETNVTNVGNAYSCPQSALDM
jgi:uncharacterized protein YbjQ (UPF0145 family)